MKLSKLVMELQDFLTGNGDCEVIEVCSIIILKEDSSGYPVDIMFSSEKVTESKTKINLLGE